MLKYQEVCNCTKVARNIYAQSKPVCIIKNAKKGLKGDSNIYVEPTKSLS